MFIPKTFLPTVSVVIIMRISKILYKAMILPVQKRLCFCKSNLNVLKEFNKMLLKIFVVKLGLSKKILKDEKKT